MNNNIKRLCTSLKCSPGHILDFQLMVAGLGLLVDPSLIELLMVHRGEFDDAKSIKENVRKVYGEEVEHLVTVCIDDWKTGNSY